MKKLKTYFKYLEPNDYVNQIFIFLITFLVVINHSKIQGWLFILLLNLTLSFLTAYFTIVYEKSQRDSEKTGNILKIIRFWYPIFTILFFFKEIYIIMIVLTPVLNDSLLISIDRMIFGIDPTVFLSEYSNPYLTEFLQIVYSLFYLMPVFYAMELYLWKRYDELKFATFLVLTGFYLSFFGYLILPAIGPRFTLYSFENLNNEIPGLFLTNTLRDLINIGESIYPGDIRNPELVAQRDAFPSGHTIVISLITYCSFRLKSKSFRFYLPYSLLMIFSTVYLRYHYVIDLIAGIGISVITILLGEYFYKDKLKNNGIKFHRKSNNLSR